MQDSIEICEISHHFGTASERIKLFHGLSCTISAGSALAIVGPSGAGKSSLLSIAAGLEMPAAGAVRFTIDGARVDALTMRANSGFIFQQFHLLPELDAIGNLALPLRLKGNRHAFDIAARWLERLGLQHRARHRPHQLSGGEQQRVAVARAFVTAPRFIFADEPTGNLDRASALQVMELIAQINRDEGTTFLISTHDEKIAATCKRQIVVGDGVVTG